MEETLRRVLKRISKIEIKPLLSKWGKIPTWKVDYNTTRYEVIQQICDFAQEAGLKLEDAHKLELLYIIENPTKKLWRAHQMNTTIGLSLTEENYEPVSFQRCLKQKLYVAFSCSVQVLEHKFALWGRVSQPSSSQIMYFVHYPFSPYILLSKGPVKLTPIVTNALKVVLGYGSVEHLELESPHPDSLAQILLHNRNPLHNYAYDKGCFKPTERSDDKPLRDFCDNRVDICHLQTMTRSKKNIKRQFGDKVQPKLPAIQISTNTRFRGQRFLPAVSSSTLVQCRTSLVGSNVLEGLRKAALLDLTHTPLPRFLTNIAKTGQQCLKITDRSDENSRHSA